MKIKTALSALVVGGGLVLFGPMVPAHASVLVSGTVECNDEGNGVPQFGYLYLVTWSITNENPTKVNSVDLSMDVGSMQHPHWDIAPGATVVTGGAVPPDVTGPGALITLSIHSNLTSVVHTATVKVVGPCPFPTESPSPTVTPSPSPSTSTSVTSPSTSGSTSHSASPSKTSRPSPTPSKKPTKHATPSPTKKTVAVCQASSSSTKCLPHTGGHGLTVGLAGLGLVGAGTALCVVGRKKKYVRQH